jgi:hypothetical protein
MTFVAVISAERPHQVPKMEAALSGLDPKWYVPLDQVTLYQNAGAKYVTGVAGEMPMKSKQLNAALDEGFSLNQTVITLDDDYNRVSKTVMVDERITSEICSLRSCILELEESLKDSPFHLAGVGPSLNAFFSGVGYKYRGKVNGQLSAQTSNVVRYDENLKSQVDFEYCFAHHAEHGGVVIHKSYLVDFHLYGRSKSKDKNYGGGLANYRTSATNLETAQVMSERYGIYIEPEEVGGSRKTRIQYKNIKWVGEPSWIIK